MNPIDTLIRELEEAPEGSRELDSKIADLTIGPDRIAYGGDALYTRSLDAALTLVPKGCRWSVGNQDMEKSKAHASCLHMAILHRALNDPGPRTENKSKAVLAMWNNTNATTPALALTIASLKARRGA